MQQWEKFRIWYSVGSLPHKGNNKEANPNSHMKLSLFHFNPIKDNSGDADQNAEIRKLMRFLTH